MPLRPACTYRSSAVASRLFTRLRRLLNQIDLHFIFGFGFALPSRALSLWAVSAPMTPHATRTTVAFSTNELRFVLQHSLRPIRYCRCLPVPQRLSCCTRFTMTAFQCCKKSHPCTGICFGSRKLCLYRTDCAASRTRIRECICECRVDPRVMLRVALSLSRNALSIRRSYFLGLLFVVWI